MRTKCKVPLATCPDLDCVRSGKCRARRPEHECRKLHMTVNERRHEIAEILEAYHREFLANNPGHVPRGLSDEDALYEARKAIVEACIEAGISGAAAQMPPSNSFTSEELRQFREGKAPKRAEEIAPLDPPEGSS
jgi:hypothetical protein